MKIYGTDKNGENIVRKWFIIVRRGHGPNVPVIPAIVIAQRVIEQNYVLPGVHPCIGLVSLN